jgi:nitrogenase molybdenum-iron cofactor biosynthesis protein NifN
MAGMTGDIRSPKLNNSILIDPLKHSPALGAAMALQGIDGSLPIIHGAQGCTFLGKVLLTKHFREPIALASSKLFVEDVVMGSEEKLGAAIDEFIEKNGPALVGVLTSGLSEVKGDDVARVVRQCNEKQSTCTVVHIPTPDYDGGMEKGYARAVEAIVSSIGSGVRSSQLNHVNILAGSHLTPADFREIRSIVEAFGMQAMMLPDLSALDGSRQGFSPVAAGGTSVAALTGMANASYTIGIGMSLEPAAKLLLRRFGTAYRMLDSIAGLAGSDLFMRTLSDISGKSLPPGYERQRRVVIDVMRDAHVYFGNKKICLALEPDLAVQTSAWLDEMGASVELAVIPTLSAAADRIRAGEVRIGDLSDITGEYDVLISNSHAERTARNVGSALYELGFPVYKTFGYTSKVTIGYQGTLMMVSEMANLLMKKH